MSKSAAATIVIDNGSYELRAGYGGESAPRAVIPSVVGQPRNQGVAMSAGLPECEVGQSALDKRGLLQCSRPVEGGLVTNWADVEKLWSHVMYRALRTSPEDYCVLLTESPFNGVDHKEKTLELLMEVFNVHSMFLGTSQVMALYSYGLTTGVVADCGYQQCSAVPVHEGYPLCRHIATSPVAGLQLTGYLSKLLEAKGYGFSTQLEQDLVNNAKESYCYVQLDEGEAVQPDAFVLPDGQAIPLEEERCKCPAVMFDFGLLGAECVPKDKIFTDAGHEYAPSIPKGLSWLIYAAINNCEASLRGELLNNMVLAGGTSLFPNTREKVVHDITSMYKEIHPNEGLVPIRMDSIAPRQCAAWLGASMLALTPLFPHLAVSRAEYLEQGSSIIHTKNL